MTSEMEERAHRARDKADQAVITVHYEGMVPQLQAEFERSAGETEIDLLHPQPQLLNRRVRSVLRIVREILPASTRVRIRISAEFNESIAALLPDLFNPSSPYDPKRGANTAVAKTIPSADGSFDIVLDAGCFINGADDDGQDLAEQTATLEHLAAHEPQHILMHLNQTDSRYYCDEVPATSEGRMYRSVVAEAVDEFRCELAAGRRVAGAMSRSAALGDDLDQFRSSLNESHRICGTDTAAAATVAFTGAKEFLKALAYLAAERLASGDGRGSSIPTPAGWDRYGSTIWPDAFDVFKSIPAADEESGTEELVTALTRLCEVIARWMPNDVGVRYEIDSTGRHSCYWDRRRY
ncbi:glutathione S-transferase [Rhodococcus sp. LBL1]|nr:glutathione S-transferase [Rhodococcus sp. LBL1]MDH6686334.1 glutathione S-transferase [Rhodococcus sp. LBL2]